MKIVVDKRKRLVYGGGMKSGMRVMKDGKEYETFGDSFVADAGWRQFVGREVVRVQPINKISGKPWQRARLVAVSDLVAK